MRHGRLLAAAAALLTLSITPAAEGRTSTTVVHCGPDAPVIGQDVSCTVSVGDFDAGSPVTPTGTVSFTTDGAGLFGNGNACTLDAGGSCSGVTYRPSAAGTHTLTASYAGDVDHVASTGTTTVAVAKRDPRLELSCALFTSVGKAVGCQVSLYDNSLEGLPGAPTGTVSFTASRAGTFDAPSCTLSAQTCSIFFTPTIDGNVTLTGTYSGDAVYKGISVVQGVSVLNASGNAEGFTLSCAPASVVVGAPATCTATYGGLAPGDAATVVFTTGGAGAFSAGSCVLSGGSCAVTYTPSAAGSHAIQAQVISNKLLVPVMATATVGATAAAPGLGATVIPGLADAGTPTASVLAPAQRVVKGTLRVSCVSRTGPIRTCVVKVRAAGRKAILGTGRATAKTKTTRLKVAVRLTAAGRKVLAAAKGAVKVQVVAKVTPRTGKASSVTTTVSITR
jgi:hypothetical protein